MNKKTLFIIAPAIVALGAITGCKGGGSDPQPTVKTLTKLEVSTALTPATYPVGFEFTKYGLNVTATWSDGSFNTVKQEDYSVSPELPYTFKDEDVASGKDFIVTYVTKSQTVHINVKSSVKNITANYSDQANGYISDPITTTISKGSKFKGVINYDGNDQHYINNVKFAKSTGYSYTDVGFTSSNTFYVTSMYDIDKVAITGSIDESGAINLSSQYKKNVYVEFTVTKDVTEGLYFYCGLGY